MRAPPEDRCDNPGCGHAWSQHNELGYCRSKTTPDHAGECICDATPRTARDGNPKTLMDVLRDEEML